MISPPRYEPRLFERDGLPAEWSVFDTFAQEFCFKEYVGDKAGAIRASARLNAARTRAFEP